MNEQKAPNGIEWTRIKTADGQTLRGYTWNPIAGCHHRCEWTMPDKSVAVCYAKTIAEKVARGSYPDGFEHHYWNPHKLEEPLKLKTPAGIFLDSMSDLMGHWVEEHQIRGVLRTCEQAEQHTFFLLTKNAPRLLKFNFPPNVWVGVSSPPDYFMGKHLEPYQQERMLKVALYTLSQIKAKVKWMSFEPLSWDVSAMVRNHGKLDWAVIGAASNGRNEYPPEEQYLRRLLDTLDAQSTPVFYKGNLKSLPYAQANWREEFPTLEAKPQQMELF